MKIVHIDGENLHMFFGNTNLGTSMKFSGKMRLIILKVTKTLSLEDTFLEKP